jgi:hypothetical protein
MLWVGSEKFMGRIVGRGFTARIAGPVAPLAAREPG